MSRPFSNLPLELGEKIFENLSDDLFSLANSSLVSRSFHNQTQRHLFQKVVLKIGPDPSNQDPDEDKSNLQALMQATDIAKYVKEITVVARTPHGAADHFTPLQVGQNIFHDTPQHPFSSLEKLKISACHDYHGVILHHSGSITDLCRQFIHFLLSHPSIKNLSLHNICDFKYLGHLPRPRNTLTLTLSGLSSLSIPVEESTRPPVDIGTLEFKSIITSSAMSSVLRCLRVEGRQPTIRLMSNAKIEMPDSVEPHELSFFWKGTGVTLKDIIIRISELDSDRNPSTSLIGLRGLRTIEFYHSNLNMSVLPRRAARILSSLPSFGESVNEETTLTYITFTYDPSSTEYGGPILFGNINDQDAWKSVDGALVGMYRKQRLDNSSVIHFKLGRNANFPNNPVNLLPELTRESAGSIQVRLENI